MTRMWRIAMLLFVALCGGRAHGVETLRGSIETPAFDHDGVADGPAVTTAYVVWRESTNAPGALPVILLHGSPGAGSNFRSLGPLIAATERIVVAPDLPGFGGSTLEVPDYSTRAHARYTLALMDALGIERAHVVGWSMGGGVALEMIDLAPDRLASLTLLGSIGAQETEGSGGYLFEHAKYALGIVLGGLTGDGPAVNSSRNFYDTDQRPYRGMMERLITPTLILHGRRDFLVSDRAAERHFAMTPAASLLMTPHSHFLPFMQPGETAAWLAPFFARHDAAGSPPLRTMTDLAPMPRRWLADGLAAVAFALPWWAVLGALALLARWRFDVAAGLALVMVADQSMDLGIAGAALLIGNLARPPGWWERRGIWRWIARLVWPLVLAAVMMFSTVLIVMSGARGLLITPVYVVVVVIATLLLAGLRRVWTRGGRQRVAAWLGRWTHHEWWPTWLLYAGVAPTIARLALKHGPMTWTCANPGIEPGGGVLGERKSAVLEGFGGSGDRPGAVLPAIRLPMRGALDERVAESVRLIEGDAVGGFPCMVKPETGYRGVGVRVVRDRDQLGTALTDARRDVAAQRYHAGPHEIGVFWVRDPATIGREAEAPAPHGRIFAVTRKTFPSIDGDGRTTLRRLIMRHPRYRKQAAVYFLEHAGRLDRVIAHGDSVVLSSTGNHMQGCIFSDGMDIVTPAFEAAIDAMLRDWQGAGGGAFDFGRFDVRYADEDELRAGRGFSIIELNGVTSEATSLYDPGKRYRWARSLLCEQWRIVYTIGARRRALGREPMSIWGVLRALVSVRNR